MPSHEFHSTPLFARQLPAETPEPDGGVPHYRVNMTLTVGDAGALWGSAARKLSDDGIQFEDLDDMIGPCAAPRVVDCIAALLAPHRIGGCRFDDFWIDCVEQGVARIDVPAPNARQDLRLVAKPQ